MSFKCDPVSRTHTKVDLSPEERDCLASLFEHVEKVEPYYKLRTLIRLGFLIGGGGVVSGLAISGWMGMFPFCLMCFTISWLMMEKILSKIEAKMLAMRSLKKEIEWRDWIQDNLNEGHDDPSKARYSLLCVIGWSKLNVFFFVAGPFLLVAMGSIVFGALWSIDIRSHKGDVQGAWGISSFIITLAAGEYPTLRNQSELIANKI